MLGWLQANAVYLFTAAVAGWLGYALVRAVRAASRAERPSVAEQFERTEKVKRQIRRKIAERKANPPEAFDSPGKPRRVTPSPQALPPIDSFGGPRRGWWRRVRAWFDRAP